MEKYLYFGKKTARSLALTASEANVQTYTLTTGLVDPIPDGVANTNTIFANGALTAELQNLHLDGTVDQHVLGSYYTSKGTTPQDNDKLFIHPNALSYDGTNLVTVKTVAQDPVYGITNSSTAGENDITFVLEKPVLAGDAAAWPASSFLGINISAAGVSNIYFKPQTGDGLGNGVDYVRVLHTSGKHKEVVDAVHDIINNNRYQTGMITVADEWTGTFTGGITAVHSINLD